MGNQRNKMSRFVDLIGKRFGRLVVIEQAEKDKWGHYEWSCLCDCGREKVIRDSSLRNGNTKSCGCWRVERLIEHGHKKRGKETPIHRSWNHMLDRCTNPDSKDYKNYGGRGITVCKRWRNSFPNFLEDMGKNWRSGLTIERKDNDDGYFPGNCYWATRKEQNRNSRHNHLITCFNRTQCLVEWAEEIKIPQSTIRARIRRGWSSERGLTTPIKKEDNND